MSDDAARVQAAELTASGKLEILELPDGIRISTTSWVGNITLGDIRIVVSPKLDQMPLIRLLRYAYKLGDLGTYVHSVTSIANHGFVDLVVRELVSEARLLVTRGLHRDYSLVRESLSSPRGRLDFSRFASNSATGQATIPCLYFPRQEDIQLNRVLLAGLREGSRLANDSLVRTEARELAGFLTPTVESIRIDREGVSRTRQSMDRRHARYSSALSLIELLVEGNAVTLDASDRRVNLSGFLFDMNLFFQALLSRFLREHLVGYSVRDEHSLKGLFAYVAGSNPRNRKAPTPRPDFAVFQGAHQIALLDAKYRDLWANALPREMLYQLALYALSRPPGTRLASILYPTMASDASEQRIVLRDPVTGGASAYVLLRPVNLTRLAELVSTPGVAASRARQSMASELAFG